MSIAKFRKVPADRKRYIIDYADWLNEAEEVTDIQMVGNVIPDAFAVDGYVISDDLKQVIFYVSGGLSGVNYDVTATITTSLGQIKQDEITFVVT
jgi:hypothetical protein